LPTLAKTSEGKAAEIEALIAPSLEAMGYEIVRVLFSGSSNRVLQIMAERRSDGGMSIEDCETVSRAVSAILDVEDPIGGSFNLEVSSAGIDRPLTRLKDFERFAGHQARLEMRIPVDGRRRFSGRLLGVSGGEVLLATDTGECRLAFDDLAKAKLVLTNELIAASQSGDGPRSESKSKDTGH
jgi:ribosome maturation factor RimP